MKPTDKQMDLFDKITIGLKKVRKRLIEFKKYKNSVIVITENGKIVKIKPE